MHKYLSAERSSCLNVESVQKSGSVCPTSHLCVVLNFLILYESSLILMSASQNVGVCILD